MKKWLLTTLCLLSFQSYADVQCSAEGIDLTLTPHNVNVHFVDGSDYHFNYNRISTETSPLTKVTTYHLITRLEASLVIAEKLNNTRIPNCGRRTTCEDHFPLNSMSAKLQLLGTDYLLSCYETF